MLYINKSICFWWYWYHLVQTVIHVKSNSHVSWNSFLNLWASAPENVSNFKPFYLTCYNNVYSLGRISLSCSELTLLPLSNFHVIISKSEWKFMWAWMPLGTSNNFASSSKWIFGLQWNPKFVAFSKWRVHEPPFSCFHGDLESTPYMHDLQEGIMFEDIRANWSRVCPKNNLHLTVFYGWILKSIVFYTEPLSQLAPDPTKTSPLLTPWSAKKNLSNLIFVFCRSTIDKEWSLS